MKYDQEISLSLIAQYVTERADLVKSLMKNFRKCEGVPLYRDPKTFNPCPEKFFRELGFLDSRCPVCDSWEYGGEWPVGVHCIVLCLYPKWIVEQFNYTILEGVFRAKQELLDIGKMEDVL